jgi:WD40 repeat protein
VRLWDAVTGAALRALKGHSHHIYSVAFSPDGKQVVSGSADKTVRLWDTVTGAVLRTLKGHSDWANLVAFLSDSNGEDILLISNDWVVEENRKLLWLPAEYRGTFISV